MGQVQQNMTEARAAVVAVDSAILDNVTRCSAMVRTCAQVVR